jgi:hypothetical protein
MDDEDIVRTVASKMLEFLGYHVKAFISSGYGDAPPGVNLQGHVGTIAKPYELKTLGATLSKALEQGK